MFFFNKLNTTKIPIDIDSTQLDGTLEWARFEGDQQPAQDIDESKLSQFLLMVVSVK